MNTRMAIAAGLLALGAITLTGCGSSSSAADNSSASVNTAGATVIDVRTPAEYDSGHLQDALNIDVQSSNFEQQISALPKDQNYVVYCRSGNRSAAAVQQMKQLGFTNVTDGGSVSEASSLTGIAVIK